MGTGIQWTNETWNPTTGCDRISPGCDNCYALTMAKRLKGMGQAKYQTDGDLRTSGPGFGLAVHRDSLTVPLHWRAPRMVFVNSMSDLGHARVPRQFAADVWGVMARAPQHTFQVLTKRPERLRRLLADDDWAWSARVSALQHGFNPDGVELNPESFPWPLPNVWLGTSIESDRYCRRADDLRETPAAVRFLSLEPLLGPLPSLDLTGIDWAIIGGESGSNAREMDLGWVRDLIRQCRDTGTAVFVKQLGEHWARHDGPVWGNRHGGDPEAWPEYLRIREFPAADEVPA
jgi:protein gp37